MLKLLKKNRKYYEAFKDAPLDADNFLLPYKRCQLSQCQSMCCHQGAPLDKSEIKEIKAVMRKYKRYFNEQIGLPKDPIYRYVTPSGQVRYQAKTRPRHFKPSANMPKHFKPQVCVFLDDEDRCSLQVLSVELGHHPWYLKPSGCWMHPVRLMRKNNPEICVLQREEYDPNIAKHYASFAPFTGCGKRCDGGQAGVEVFHEELKWLGQAMDRDLIGEIEAYRTHIESDDVVA